MSAPLRVILPDEVRLRILAHARQNPAAECCGLLIGTGEEAVHIASAEAAENVAADPAARFEINPQRQFDVLRRLRGTAQRIIGHYHSHPGGPAAPSAHDRAMAHDPEAVWLIVAPETADVAAFICTDQTQGFRPLLISAGP